MNTLASAGFTALDWSVLVLYFGLLAGTGWWFSRREQKSTDDYFLGGRRMPTWAVAVSVLATSLSAATFIGGPQQAYKGDLTYLATNIGMILAALVIAVFFIPAFFRAKVSTVYELLEGRFGTPSKRAASGMFMIGRVFASGARLFMVGLPAALILFGEPGAIDGAIPPSPDWQIFVAIGLMTAVGIAYTLVGGISSVIWSDVIQTGVFLVAVTAAIILLLTRIPIGPGEIVDVLQDAPGTSDTAGNAGKMTLLNLSGDPTQPFTIWAVLIGFTLLGIASYGTDQDLVQRMLTCKNARSGSASVIYAQLIGVPVVVLFMTAGLLLFVFYQRPEIMGAGGPGAAPDDSRTVFLNFILREMPAGMTGLMMAGLFAAGLSSLNSAINAMASTFVSDFYKPLVPGASERHYVHVGRTAVVIWGLTLGSFACFCVVWQRASGTTLLDFALGVMTFAYSGLLGVYFTAIFTKRGSNASVLAALVVGFMAILVMQDFEPVRDLLAPVLERSARIESGYAWLVALAFPWKLTVGTTLAFAVCQIGSAKKQPAREAVSAE